MLKKTITYKNLAKVEVTTTLYFNINEITLTENLDLVDKFENLQKMFSEKRDLTMAENSVILEFLKNLIRISYGNRLDDEHFDQSEEIWKRFRSSSAYNAFTMSLFENTDEANDFMVNIFPDTLMEQAKIAQLKLDSMKDVELPKEAIESKTPVRPPTQDHKSKAVNVEKKQTEREELEARLANLRAKEYADNEDKETPVIQ